MLGISDFPPTKSWICRFYKVPCEDKPESSVVFKSCPVVVSFSGSDKFYRDLAKSGAVWYLGVISCGRIWSMRCDVRAFVEFKGCSSGDVCREVVSLPAYYLLGSIC